MATTFLKVSNRAISTIDGGIADDALALDVAAGEGVLFPDEFPFHITIEDEILSCTNRVGDTLTVVRAQQDTVAAAHLDGVDVQLRITAKSISDLNNAVNTLEERTLVKVAYKASDETVNNSTTMQDDDDLVLAVGADEDWVIEMMLRVTTGGIPEFKWQLTIPANGAAKAIDALLIASEAYGLLVAFDATAARVYNDDGTDIWCFAKIIYIGGDTAGDVQLQWAQNALQESDTKVLAGSYLIAHKLA